VYSLNYHLVWCPKYRRPVLTGVVIHRLRELLATKASEIDAEIHALEVMSEATVRHSVDSQRGR
jgi:putative transposase